MEEKNHVVYIQLLWPDKKKEVILLNLSWKPDPAKPDAGPAKMK
jgi:hypothetical protein